MSGIYPIRPHTCRVCKHFQITEPDDKKPYAIVGACTFKPVIPEAAVKAYNPPFGYIYTNMQSGENCAAFEPQKFVHWKTKETIIWSKVQVTTVDPDGTIKYWRSAEKVILLPNSWWAESEELVYSVEGCPGLVISDWRYLIEFRPTGD